MGPMRPGAGPSHGRLPALLPLLRLLPLLLGVLLAAGREGASQAPALALAPEQPPQVPYCLAPLPLFDQPSRLEFQSLEHGRPSSTLVLRDSNALTLLSQDQLTVSAWSELRHGALFHSEQKTHQVLSLGSSAPGLPHGSVVHVIRADTPRPALVAFSPTEARLLLSDGSGAIFTDAGMVLLAATASSHNHASLLVVDSQNLVRVVSLLNSAASDLMITGLTGTPGLRALRGSGYTFHLWDASTYHFLDLSLSLDPSSSSAEAVIRHVAVTRVSPSTPSDRDDLFFLLDNGTWLPCLACSSLAPVPGVPSPVFPHPGASLSGRVLAQPGFELRPSDHTGHFFFHEQASHNGTPDVLWRLDVSTDGLTFQPSRVLIPSEAGPLANLRLVNTYLGGRFVPVLAGTQLLLDHSHFSCDQDLTIVCDPEEPTGWRCKPGHQMSTFANDGRLCSACLPGFYYQRDSSTSQIECKPCPQQGCEVCTAASCLACQPGLLLARPATNQASCVQNCPEGLHQEGTLCLPLDTWTVEQPTLEQVAVSVKDDDGASLNPTESLIPTRLTMSSTEALLPWAAPLPLRPTHFLSLRNGILPLLIQPSADGSPPFRAIELFSLPAISFKVLDGLERVVSVANSRPVLELFYCLEGSSGGLRRVRVTCQTGSHQVPEQPCVAAFQIDNQFLLPGCDALAEIDANNLMVRVVGGLHFLLSTPSSDNWVIKPVSSLPTTGRPGILPALGLTSHNLLVFHQHGPGLGPSPRAVSLPLMVAGDPRVNATATSLLDPQGLAQLEMTSVLTLRATAPAPDHFLVGLRPDPSHPGR
ncbi:hypothetical protein H696_05380 [Fonticula alba]|uniref:TNFR-Cys domain-containing protein n=1 Tax=Fonticula alba TaxID=691883 RepID=A0A058Z3M4_FONAL|nr:hypothetical protein H696_05380 [Fonticula alba]KCV68122.1 hypothetical protein H696_05380 [Fonticula alba]|eukprot:XP_009497496.1 hypothetical protein H696_05380 [Fonticula alba]